IERRPAALLAPVRISTPPGNSLDSTVLPLSRERRSFTRSRRTSLSSISGSIRCLELRLASSTVGATAIIGPGAWWMTYPIHELPHSVPPICAPFIRATRCTGEDGDRQSMISRRYGVRWVRQRPGSEEARCDRTLYWSAHCETVSSG